MQIWVSGMLAAQETGHAGTVEDGVNAGERFELLCTKQSEQRPAARHGGAISSEGRYGEAGNGRPGP